MPLLRLCHPRTFFASVFVLALAFSQSALSDEAHDASKKREQTDVKTGSSRVVCGENGTSLDDLKRQHPLVSEQEHSYTVNNTIALGAGTSATSAIKQRDKALVSDFDAHTAVWLAHALACPNIKQEDLLKFLQEEVPSKFLTESHWESVFIKGDHWYNNRTEMQWVERPAKATYENREKYLKTKELATIYQLVLERFAGDSELASALAEQLQEFAKARFEKRDPKLNEKLTKIILALGKKFREGKLNDISEAEKNLIGFLTEERPSLSEKLWGSYLSSAYRALFLQGEPKVASTGSGSYSTDASSNKFILSGDGVLPTSLQAAFKQISEHSARNNSEDKSLFWKDSKNPVLIELTNLAEPQRSHLRKWARERVFAVQEGKVEGGDPLVQEALVQVLSALEGKYDAKDRKALLADYSSLHTTLSHQREKIASHPENWNLASQADSFADRLKKNFGIELTEEARKNFLSLGSAERRVLLELSEKPGDNHKKILQGLVGNLTSASVVELTFQDTDARKVYFDQIQKDLDLKGDIKTETDKLIQSLVEQDLKANAKTVAQARALRAKLIAEFRRAVEEGQKGQVEADALARLLNLSEEVGLTAEQRRPLDATQTQVDLSHYSVPITLTKLDAEENALNVVHQELVRSRGLADDRASLETEISKVIEELYPKGMSVPAHTRALIAQLLLPENAPYLSMLRRLKNISEIRDGLMTGPSFRALGNEFRTLLITPLPNLIEAKLSEYAPKAHKLAVETQGDKYQQLLLKNMMLNPEGFVTTLRRANEGKELDRLAGGQADTMEAITKLAAIQFLKSQGQLDGIVTSEVVEGLSENPEMVSRLTGVDLKDLMEKPDLRKEAKNRIKLAIAAQMKEVMDNLIQDAATTVLRGEGFDEASKKNLAQKQALAIAIRKLAGDIPQGLPADAILNSLNRYNEVGSKVRNEISTLLLKSNELPQLNTGINDTLNAVMDRQLRRLSLEFNHKNLDYSEKFSKFELLRTEHRRLDIDPNTSRDLWNKEVERHTNYSAKMQEEKEPLVRLNNRKFWMQGYDENLRYDEGVLRSAEKEALAALELRDAVAGKKKVEGISRLGDLRNSMNGLRDMYLLSMKENYEQRGDILKWAEPDYAGQLIEKYIKSIALPKALTDEDKEEIRKNAKAFLDSVAKQQAASLKQQEETDRNINRFIDNHYGEELQRFPEEQREQRRVSYYNMVYGLIGKAQATKDKIKLYAEGMTDQFDGMSTHLVGKDENRRQAFEKLASSVGPSEGNDKGKLTDMATKFVDEQMQADLDKLTDPNARAQQREFLIGQLAQRLENKYRTGKTTRFATVDQNWHEKYNAEELKYIAGEAFRGQNPALKWNEEQWNRELNEAHKIAQTAQRKEDRETFKALLKLQALGIGFDGRSVEIDNNTRLHWAHVSDFLIPKVGREHMKDNGWEACDMVDSGGDPEMRAVCQANRYKGLNITPEHEKSGNDQLMAALEIVNRNGIPLRINHAGYQATSSDGKRTLEDFLVTMYNQVNNGKSTYLLPLGEHDAVRVSVDPNTGKLSYELRNNKALSARLQKCMEEVNHLRARHQIAVERYGQFSTAFTQVMRGGGETWISKEMNQAWNDYVGAVNRCSDYGGIKNSSGVTGQQFIDDERDSKMHYQLKLAEHANKKFESNLNVIEDAAWMTIATVATFGIINPGLSALATTARAGLAAETVAGLSFGQKMFYLAARSNKARTVLNAGTTLLERGLPAWNAATKAYGKKWLEGAGYAAIPLVPVYGYENYLQSKANEKAKQLHADGKFVAPKREDYKTYAEYKAAKDEWDDLVARTDRDDNGKPDSLEEIGEVSTILPDVADTWNSLAGGGEFFGGMSGIHTLFPKLPGISYLSVFGGSLNSNMRDILRGKKTLSKSLVDSGVTTLTMAPGLMFMNNAQFMYKLPGMQTKIGLGLFGPEMGRVANTAAIHYLNKAGHVAAEHIGLVDAPPEKDGPMTASDRIAYWSNEILGWKFAMDMSKAAKLKHVASELAKAPKPKSANGTDVAVVAPELAAKSGKAKESSQTYDSLVQRYGKKTVMESIYMLSPEQLLSAEDPRVFNLAAASVGQSPAKLRELFDVHLNGTKAQLFKEMGVTGLPAIEAPGAQQKNSFLSKALGKVGNGTLQLLDGSHGWTHNYAEMYQNFNNNVLTAYRTAREPEVKKNVADYILRRPEVLMEMKATDLQFTADSKKYDGYLLEGLANSKAASTALSNPFSQRENALNTGIKKNGRFHNIYAGGFAEYVRRRVLDGTAKERTIGTLLDNYQRRFDSGEFDGVFGEFEAAVARQSQPAANAQ